MWGLTSGHRFESYHAPWGSYWTLLERHSGCQGPCPTVEVPPTSPCTIRSWYCCLCQLRRLSPFPSQVVGSQARILYSDQKGRVAIAVAINQAIACRRIKVRCPVLQGKHPLTSSHCLSCPGPSRLCLGCTPQPSGWDDTPVGPQQPSA